MIASRLTTQKGSNTPDDKNSQVIIIITIINTINRNSSKERKIRQRVNVRRMNECEL